MKARIGATVCVALPFGGHRELSPGAGEDFANINCGEVGLPVFKFHPPVAVVFELVIKSFFEALIVVPRLILIGKRSLPDRLARTPRITDEQKLKIPNVGKVPHLPDAVCLVELDSFGSDTVNWSAFLLVNLILANDDEALLVKFL